MCGGSCCPGPTAQSCRGLSPRVRGKQRSRATKAGRRRSIPACAGEARNAGGGGRGDAVYPRVCGGSDPQLAAMMSAKGLSPRVRGKRPGSSAAKPASGSIPACAGEAQRPAGKPIARWVYPRVCGGSAVGVPTAPVCEGLSPRVRGKPDRQHGRAVGIRSIPACAGEAGTWRLPGIPGRVYPRVCGGSRSHQHGRGHSAGLSPRVRGKLGGLPAGSK